MNDLETRLRESLDRNIGGPAMRPITDEARARVTRSRRRLAAAAALVVVAVLGLASAAVPALTRFTSKPAEGAPWPSVIIGDPRDAYVNGAEVGDIVGLRYVLSSGTVDGMPYSLEGWTSRKLDAGGPAPCLYLAGPADPTSVPASPGPQPPGAVAATGGVGGYCAPTTDLGSKFGWPQFPAKTDLILRTVAPGGGGICRTCVVGATGPFAGLGFVTERVASLAITLADGTVHDVKIDRFPNAWHVGVFVYFQPDVSREGTLRAYDRSGQLLATAPICDSWNCDVSDVRQIVAVQDVPSPSNVDAPTLPYYAVTGDFPVVDPLADQQRPNLGSSDATSLVAGSVSGSAFDAYASTSPTCPAGTTFGVAIVADGSTSTNRSNFCSTTTDVESGGSWFLRTDPDLIPDAVVVMGIVSSDRYGDVRVTLDDGSSQYLRLFAGPDPSTSFFTAVVPDAQGGTVVFDAPDGTGLAQQAFTAGTASTYRG